MPARFALVILCMLCPLFVQAAEVLRVGLSADYPPLAFRQDGRIVGIEPDSALAVGEIIGRKISLVETPFENLVPALLKGEIDVIMSGFSVTATRAQQLIFTEPYMRTGQMVILHRDNLVRFGQPWAVYRPGVRVGVEPGTTGADFAENKLPDARLVFFKDPQAAFAGLRGNEIDLYIHDAPTSWRLATTRDDSDLISLYTPLTEEMLAWAVRPGDDVLAGKLNRALAVMKANGTLNYILNRWIPVRVEVR